MKYLSVFSGIEAESLCVNEVRGTKQCRYKDIQEEIR